jgi:uncharacterized protein
MSVRTKVFDFPGSQGQRLSGRLDLPDGTATAYAVLAHCFTCSKNSVAAVRIARALAARGIGVLRFDFTGRGQSEGDFSHATFSGDVADLTAAVQAMEQAGHPPGILIGHSLGGAAVLAAAGGLGLPGIAAVVTIGAPCDTQHVIRLLDRSLDRILHKGEACVRLGGESFVIRRAFVEDLRAQDQRRRIAHLGRPLLILHSPRDEVVSVESAGATFQESMRKCGATFVVPMAALIVGPVNVLRWRAP